jgi:hypothetical protein
MNVNCTLVVLVQWSQHIRSLTFSYAGRFAIFHKFFLAIYDVRADVRHKYNPEF